MLEAAVSIAAGTPAFGSVAVPEPGPVRPCRPAPLGADDGRHATTDAT